MKTLYIIASPRGEMSKSIELWNYITNKIGWEIITLNLFEEKIPYISFPVIAENYWFMEKDSLPHEDKKILEIQEKYINQLKNVDNLVIATPMWNFGMPAVLKAWFDLVLKVNSTFKIENWNYLWLVKNIKNTYVVWARWSKFIGTPMQSYDNLTNHINTMLWFVWIQAKNYWLEWTSSLSETELKNEIEKVKKEVDLDF